MRWDDVNARARGLATHLLDGAALRRLAAARDLPESLAQLAAIGYPLESGGVATDLPSLDRAVSRVAANRVALLDRWLGRRRMVLAVVLEHEELLALRALVRGAAEGASPGSRLRNAVPTRGLPSRALDRLARVPTLPDLAHELVRLGHPAGRVVQGVLDDTPAGGLAAMEWALARLFGERARRAARRGGPVLRCYVAERVDQENLRTLLLASDGEEARAAGRYLEGGERITRSAFERIRALPGGEGRVVALRALFEGTAIGAALGAEPLDPVSLEPRATAARVAWLHGLARRDPLGPAVLLEVLERILAEARALRAIAAGVALGAPAGALAPLLPEAA